MTLTQAGLCEGYGGLTLAVAGVLGAELAWYSEIDPAAVKVQEHHHPGVPNHGDLTTTDWADAERVDVLTGGWPCQPWSTAGKRKGAADERAIWPHVARAVRALRPRLVFLENVASIAPAGELARAAGDLAALGYVGSWRRIRASDVGAPHQRARIFIVARPAAADPADLGHERSRAARRRRAGSAHSGHPATRSDGGQVRQQPVTLAGRSHQAVAGRAGEAAADAAGAERRGAQPDDLGSAAERAAELGERAGEIAWAGYAPAIRQWEHVTGRAAPAPTVLGKRGGRQLSARFTEWLMGLPDGWVCDVPDLTRNQQLKLCGNGVVPQQAAHALRLMLAADTPARRTA